MARNTQINYNTCNRGSDFVFSLLTFCFSQAFSGYRCISVQPKPMIEFVESEMPGQIRARSRSPFSSPPGMNCYTSPRFHPFFSIFKGYKKLPADGAAPQISCLSLSRRRLCLLSSCRIRRTDQDLSIAAFARPICIFMSVPVPYPAMVFRLKTNLPVLHFPAPGQSSASPVQAQTGAYRSLSSTSRMNAAGSNCPPATILKILGLHPLTRMTPSSFIRTGC